MKSPRHSRFSLARPDTSDQFTAHTVSQDLHNVTVTILFVKFSSKIYTFAWLNSIRTEGFGANWAQLRRNVPANLIDNECMKNAYCPKDEATVLLRSESRTKPPLLCLNNKKLFDSSKLVRGLNIAILNSNKSVIGVHYLSVQDSDFSVIKLLAQVQSYQIIIGTSYGDVSSKISAETRQLLRLFGLSLAQYKTESSILFMGQLGLLVPAAFEKVVPLEIAEPKYHVRCLKSPMGKLANVTIQIPEAHHIDEHVVAQLSAVKGQKMKVNLGAELPNCGHSENCPEDEIPMFFIRGKTKMIHLNCASMEDCKIIDRDLNSAGRGLNLVVIDSKTHQVMRTGHYDTYLEDSSALVLFLEQLSPGEILAVISFDEASNRFKPHISPEIPCFMVFHWPKGIDGYTPFEDMNLASGNDWAKPIRQTICVPSVLDGLKTVNNGLSKTQNMLRRHFCSRYDGYEDFCDESRLDIPLVPRSSQTHLPSTDPIYTVPILLAGGLNMNNIRLCLESIYVQDGINPQNVVVAFDSIYGEISDLSALFHVRALPINNSASYNDFVLEGIDHMMTLFPYAPCIIVIEEDMILLPVVKSRDVDVASVYRIENGTAAAAVSRVEHIKTFDLVSLTKNDGTRKEPSKIAIYYRLSEESYDAELKEVIENGWKFHVKDYVDCHDGIFDAHGVSNFDNITIATIIIVYDENTSVLSQLAQCFNLYIVNNHPLGSYKGTIQ
ncbi:Protein O-linked-mannose beta-1,2-N-acetylglucosaminyltransferase 1 [Dirofilaria immitis]|nr:Protein O-linked-mannose beta-1,2-N-acetylglucosaminyltransferase 1 [Dirofilaria immitis]